MFIMPSGIQVQYREKTRAVRLGERENRNVPKINFADSVYNNLWEIPFPESAESVCGFSYCR